MGPSYVRLGWPLAQRLQLRIISTNIVNCRNAPMINRQITRTVHSNGNCGNEGWTENAGPENGGPNKQDRKMEEQQPEADYGM